MALLRYYVYKSKDCDCIWERMKDKNDESIDIEVDVCDEHDTEGFRIPYFNIAKQEIQEKTHGGTVRDGKMIRQYTGHKELYEQNKLEQNMRKFRRMTKTQKANSKDYQEAKGELDAKRKEGLKNL